MAKLFIIIPTSLYHSELKHVSSFVLPPSLILSLLPSLSHRFIDDDPKRSLKLLLLSSEAKSSSWIIKYFLPNSCQGNSGLLFQIIVIHPQSEFILFHLISQHFPVSLALFLSLSLSSVPVYPKNTRTTTSHALTTTTTSTHKNTKTPINYLRRRIRWHRLWFQLVKVWIKQLGQGVIILTDQHI